MSTTEPRADVVQEEDRVPALRAWLTVAGTSALTLLLIGAAWWLLRVYTGRFTTTAGPGPGRAVAEEPDLPPTFRHGLRAEPGERPGLRAPEPGWGWIDRERGVATVPLDVAMDLVVRLYLEQGDVERAEPAEGGAP